MAQDSHGDGDARSGQNQADSNLIEEFELRKGPAPGEKRRPDETPGDESQEHLSVEEQVANPNIHYGSQTPPEVFLGEIEEDAPPPRPDEIPEIPADEHAPSKGDPVDPGPFDDLRGVDLEIPQTKPVFSSGSPRRPVTDEESAAPATESRAPTEPVTTPNEALGAVPSLDGAAAPAPQTADDPPTTVAPPPGGNTPPVASNLGYSGVQEGGAAQSFAFGRPTRTAIPWPTPFWPSRRKAASSTTATAPSPSIPAPGSRISASAKPAM